LRPRRAHKLDLFMSPSPSPAHPALSPRPQHLVLMVQNVHGEKVGCAALVDVAEVCGPV